MDPRDLSAHTPYRAGRGVEEVARERGLDPDTLVKLSSNENPFGPSPAAVEAIRAAAPTVHTYPKAEHTDLSARLADDWNVALEQVWLSPGGDGVLDYLARAFLDPGDSVLVPEPGFAYYPMSARYRDATVDSYPLHKSEDFAQTPANVLDSYDGHRIVYVTTPHNPTGSEMALSDIETVAAETADETLVLVDEAYAEFTDAPNAHGLVDDREDVAILRTFSKAYGLAGLRLGYALVPEAWADAYERVNTPFAVNSLACRAGLAALDDEEHVERTVETARWAREYMHDHLDAPTWESGGNFVLAEVGDGEAVTDAAMDEGVIVRDCSSFGLPECVRITCGTREGTERAVGVLNEVVD
ncbi:MULTISPECIES: histidinol-phosphate transaminase [Salinibaculum]|uniref:histidinol-phosphate transaminase n=1 Tax=Salinibaculum TaxID=2732368 RepID=UPI0030CE5FF2